jgi:trehalose synthase
VPNPILKKVIPLKEIHRADFLKFTSMEEKDALLKQASLLRGKRVVHVNAVAKGGGVAEILESLVPYLRSLGIESDWYFIDPAVVGEKFFAVTNKIHNALQGAPVHIGVREWAGYEKVEKRIASELDTIDCDVLALNDPQVLLAGYLMKKKQRKVYFSHIDTSSALPSAWAKLHSAVISYDKIVFSNRDFVNGDVPARRVKVFTPAIDPLSPKQRIVSRKRARYYLRRHGGMPVTGPLVVQVSRFDVWKNPLGVVQAFRLIRDTYPDARLALVGFEEAKDNPAALAVFKDVHAVVGKSPDVFLFFNPVGKDISEFTTMAQNAADVVIQNSVREGFGLVVAEAMWKRQAVIGGPASGIRKQIKNGRNGFIVSSPEELAEKAIYLLSHSAEKKKMGDAARETVREHFLFPRLVLDHVRLYRSCLR